MGRFDQASIVAVRWEAVVGVLLWEEEQITALEACLDEARSGRPTLLVVEGEPGAGKSSLLDELMLRAADFEIRVASGVESLDSPAAFSALRDWGLNLTTPDAGGRLSPYAAAQSLRAAVDRWSVHAPVLLRLNDLQWTDPESLESVRWLLARSEGDRLLVAVDARSGSGENTVDALARGRPGDEGVQRLRLDGLSRALAQRLVTLHRPGLSAISARRLWEHTGGNPLYLTALLAEFGESDLSQARQGLPAPADFAALVQRRGARLSETAYKALQAVAVLGSDWSSVLDVAAVAGLAASTSAVQEAAESRLLAIRQDYGLKVAPSHGLVRAAVYQQIPLDRRRLLHLRAADITTGRERLEHRLAATDSHNDELADDLEAWAHALHDRNDYREASHYFDAAAGVSSRASERVRRRGESRWNEVLLGPGDFASEQSAPPQDEPMGAGEASVLAMADLHRNEVHKALGRLEGLEDRTLAAAPGVVRYRVGVLTAYSRMLVGASTDRVDAALDIAHTASVQDPALRSLESPTRGYMAARKFGGKVAALWRDLPDNPADASRDNFSLLVWRGLFRVYLLRPREAAADFVNAVSIGSKYGASQSFHTYLGLARWLLGDWPLARVSFNVGLEVFNAASGWAPEYEAALLLSTEGRGDEADRLIEAALVQSEQAPWPEGRLNLLIVLTVRCHAAGNPRQRVEEIRTFYPDLGELLDGVSPVDTLILMHVAMSALMTGRLDVADRAVATMRAEAGAGPSLQPIASWLQGLLAHSRGDHAAARRLVRAAAADGSNELPFYRAHIWADLARITDGHSNAEAAACRERALEIYQGLGAAPYVERMQRLAATGRAGTRIGPAAPAPAGAPLVLTEREQDVLTLVVNGLSYAQISQELFVTQSTVSYHLSNIYAKFSVRTRHQLTALVRSDPDLLKATSRSPK